MATIDEELKALLIKHMNKEEAASLKQEFMMASLEKEVNKLDSKIEAQTSKIDKLNDKIDNKIEQIYSKIEQNSNHYNEKLEKNGASIIKLQTINKEKKIEMAKKVGVITVIIGAVVTTVLNFLSSLTLPF